MIQIRAEEPSDWAVVGDIVRGAFDSGLQANLVETLRDASDPQVSLVALVSGELVGHIFFSPVSFESKCAPPAAQLSPVSVKPTAQGKGVGAELVRAGIRKSQETGWSAIFLVGNPAYYSRFGFRVAGPLGLHCLGEHDSYLQYLELQPGCLQEAQGLVSFHPAFTNLEVRGPNA